MVRCSAALCACALALGCSASGPSESGYPAAIDMAIEYCVHEAACGPVELSQIGFANCVLGVLRHDELDAREQARCGAGAGGDCDVFRACSGVVLEESTSCVPACEGDHAILCGTGALLRIDCSRVGQGNHCALFTDVFSGATAAECASELCHAMHGESLCDGESIVACDPTGLRTRVTCADGTRCITQGPPGSQSASCEPALECAESFCQGSVRNRCFAGWGSPTDCAVFGQECVRDALDAWCRPTATECAPSDAPRCEGDVLVMCAPSGELRRYDCAENGFSACAPADSPLRIAECTPHRP